MKKIDLSEAVHILTNIVVIAGIVFLGIELAQNNELMVAEGQFNRLFVATETATIVAENPALANLLVKATNNEELTQSEQLRLNMYNYRVLMNMQWTFRELPRSDLPIETWRRNAAQPYRRQYWEKREAEFYPEFVRFMKESASMQHNRRYRARP